ncbi:MAG: amidohydrolase family protein [Phycisphaerales bacterium]
MKPFFQLRSVVLTAATLVLTLAASHSASAQLGRQSPAAIEHARVVTGDGEVIDDCTIIIQGGRIVAFGAGLEAPAGARKIDATGQTITPGLIDVCGSIASTASSGSDATHIAADAFDRYAIDEIEEALSQGVTTTYLPPRGGRGVCGVASIMRLSPNPSGSYGAVLEQDAALCINLSSGDSALARLSIFDGVRNAFKGARAYRESLETYEEELETYKEELEKMKKGEVAKPADGEKKPAEADTKEDDAGAQPAPAEQPGDRPGPGRRRGGQRPGAGGGNNQPAQANQPANGEKKDDDGPKKPTRPRRDAGAEVLLRVIDHELPVRIMASDSADISNAIELAREYGFDLILESATEAGQLADILAQEDARVVLDYAANRATEPGHTQRTLNRNIKAMEDAGILWAIGSGASRDGGGRFLLAQAELAAQAGDDMVALELVTARAADFLALGDQIGRIARGCSADLVFWSKDPSDPSARVEKVYIEGKVAWQRETTQQPATARAEDEQE